MIRHYIYAGLDFLYDKKGRYYFIEANSAPGVHGRVNVLKKISMYMKKQGKELCVMTSLKFRKHKGYPKLWVYNTMKEFIPNLRLCYEERNIGRKKTLIDSKKKVFSPDCIFKNEGKVPVYFEDKIPVINSRSVTAVTKNKIKTYEAVLKHIPNLRVPKTFVINNESEARAVMNKNPLVFQNGFVIKPIDGALGRGVRVYDSPDVRFEVSHRMILQQRIIPKLIHGCYWDLRVHLLDGKTIGGIIRQSKKNITNTARGGTASPAPSKLLKTVTTISERIVDAIEKETRRMHANS